MRGVASTVQPMAVKARELFDKLRDNRSRAWTIVWLASGFLLTIVMLVVSESSHYRFARENEALLRAVRLTAVLSDIVGHAARVESGERGFLLTRDNAYLEPYQRSLRALEGLLEETREAGPGSISVKDRFVLARLVGEKLGEIESTLKLYQFEGMDAAMKLVNSDVGKVKMTQIEDQVLRMSAERQAWIKERTGQWERDLMISRISIATLALFTIVSLFVFARRGLREIRRERDLSRELADHRDRLEHTVRERTQELSSLSSSLQQVQEHERGRLARELHDELGAILTSSKMGLSLALSKLPEGSADIYAKVRSVMSALDSGIDLKRRLIEDLRPSALDHLGLTATLQMYVEETCTRAGMRYHHAIDEVAPLDAAISIAVFRVVQEAMTNTLKYAKATEIEVGLTRNANSVSVRVADNGEGFDLATASQVKKHGLVGMRQRMVALGGQLSLESVRGRGTVVSCFIPLDVRPD